MIITYDFWPCFGKLTSEVKAMTGDIIKIAKRDAARGEDGYKTFSVRIKEDTVAALDALALKSNRSRNELMNIILAFGVTHAIIEE